jgi:hypothetical protein
LGGVLSSAGGAFLVFLGGFLGMSRNEAPLCNQNHLGVSRKIPSLARERSLKLRFS